MSGDAIVGALVRLFGIDDSDLLRGIIYAVLGALVIVVVIYGYQFMLLVNKVVVSANTVLILLGVVAYAGRSTAATTPALGAYALGTFWPTFMLSALIVMGNPIASARSSATGRGTSPNGTPTARLLGATFLGQLVTLVPFLFGVGTATLVAGEADYVVALISVSPALVRRAADRRGLPRRHVHRRHVALRHRPGLLVGVPAAEPRCRRRCSSARWRSSSSWSAAWPSTCSPASTRSSARSSSARPPG